MDENREACDCPIDCQINCTVKALKSIAREVHLPSVVQSEFNEAMRTLFLQKENKTTTLFNNLSPLVQRSAILENIRWTQAAYAHTRAYDACVQWIFSKMALRWTRGDELLNKVILFSYKKCSSRFIKFRLNHWWQMYYSDDASHTFLDLDSVIYFAVNGTVTSLLVLIQNILNCVPKTNCFTCLGRHGGLIKWLMTKCSFWTPFWSGVTLQHD